MKNQKGFGHLGILLIIIVIAAVAGAGYWVWHNHDKNKTNNSTTSTQAPVAATAKPTVADPYAGWKTYTSAYEKSSFKYPSTWKLSKLDNITGLPGVDGRKLTSPSGNVTISWESAVGGLGGACDDKHMPPHTTADGLNACPYFTLLEKQKLVGANLFYTAGVVTHNGSTYMPWFALGDKTFGMLKTGGYLGVMVFQAKHSQYTVSFNGGDPISGNSFTATTKAKAEAFFDTAEAKEAKLILLSYSY